MHKELGKISNIIFGMGGYQDAQFGVWITFTMSGSGICAGKGVWSDAPSKNANWTNEERIRIIGQISLEINEWLKQAKVSSLDKLKGIPVEITFDKEFGKMVSWRILTEVL